jgi:hypothetical protein
MMELEWVAEYRMQTDSLHVDEYDLTDEPYRVTDFEMQADSWWMAEPLDGMEQLEAATGL